MQQQNLEERIQQLEDKVRILTELSEVSSALNSRVQLEPLLKHIMDVAVEITECEAASVLLWNRNRKQLFFAATTSTSAYDLIGTPVPMNSIAGLVLERESNCRGEQCSQRPPPLPKSR